MKIRILLGLMLAAGFPVSAKEKERVDWVARLTSPDIETRRDAIDRIQTLDDPRIPEACLPLLTDEGMSIRRQAARAIGSRAGEIPKARVGVFVKALEEYSNDASSGVGDDDRMVAQRAIGLLTGKFSKEAFSVSPGGKWVLYEQRRLPMIADSKLTHHESLPVKVPRVSNQWENWTDTRVERGETVDADGPGSRRLKLMTTAWDLDQLFHPHWSADGQALELEPWVMLRFYKPICLWRSVDGESRVFEVESFKRLYGKRFPHWATTLDFVRWRDSRAILRIYDCDSPEPDSTEPFDPKGILVSVDVNDWKMRIEEDPAKSGGG